MKTIPLFFRTLLNLTLFMFCFSSPAEGWLQFVNSPPPTRVFERDPFSLQLTLVPTNAGKVEFLYAPAGTTDFTLFKTVAGKSPVSIAPAPGIFSGGTFRLTDIAPGAVVSALVRGWTGPFASWEDAINSGTAKIGVSDIFQVDTTDPNELPVPAPPANIITSVPGHGFSGLILQIPEPTCLSLFALSLVGMVLARQRSTVNSR